MFASNFFPDELKNALFYPLFKSGTKTNLNNYRPVRSSALFPKFLKNHFFSGSPIFKKKIKSCIQINMAFDLYNTQLIWHSKKLISHVIIAWESKELILSTFTDLSQAFDFIDHQVLLPKLSFYGIRTNYCFKWLESYLHQYYRVKANHVISIPLYIKTRVP